MRRDTLLTRQKIISTAERLFAEQGVDAVSLNEITREAGQKNKSALSYHFGDDGRDSKISLLQAIIQKHETTILEQRNAYLDDLVDRRALSIESIVRAFVYPLASLLDDEDGGRYYLCILAQLSSSPQLSLYKLRPDYIAETERVMKLLRDLTPETPEELRMPRLMQASSLLFHSLAYLSSVTQKQKGSQRLAQLFIDSLVDTIVSIIETPPSRTTRMALAEAG